MTASQLPPGAVVEADAQFIYVRDAWGGTVAELADPMCWLKVLSQAWARWREFTRTPTTPARVDSLGREPR